MIAMDEDALICDFAETYHIYDYRQLPPRYAAILACGLGSNSRIKLMLSESKIDTQTTLLAALLDEVAILNWRQTKDGHKGRNRPKSVFKALTDIETNNNDIESFNTIEEFEKERMRIIEEKYGN